MTKLQKLEERIRELVPPPDGVYIPMMLPPLTWYHDRPLSEQSPELIDFLYSVFYPDNNNEDE